MNKEKLTYKQSYARLEEIQGLIEADELDVDELSEILKEASLLIKTCKNKLLLINEETKKSLEEIK